ncbi:MULTISPECIES: 2-octaprenyl-6-methoxyphenyl hydroxylase [Arsenophonus]|uniref:2-octaprenyl-6-methoxyphenyl hydroxylase n=1 Tax=Arsenophonus TaxID=637 RepID=UPI0015D76E9E|nr:MULTISPECIES: 2-octaprenyl-6-methoxyphenyl hydroxylase [Arsenophonus]UBX28443.1 2-octaprenyl-6-methoxyphenyl hydroxylase [Arsenophonus apicola]
MKVIIVGGGMTGASLALAISAFSQGKVQVALIEASLPNKSHPGFDARTIALAYDTCRQFEQIGIWHGLKKYVTPITHIHVSEYGHAGAVNMYAKDYSLSALGYVVELHDAGNHLFEQLEKAPNIELYCPDEVISVERTIEQVSVKLKTGKVLTGQLLVAADGSDSMIGKASQIEWQRDSYQQCAIIANVLTSEAPHGRAFERFTQYGPLAMLPMTKGRSSLVWCHPLENQQHIMQWSNDQFMAELQKWFGWRLGEIKAVSERYCFPLTLSQAKRVISHRLVLVGNAAQTLHPIAGQGFNLAMRDVMLLATIISGVGNYGGDMGAYSVLSQYQKHRCNDRHCTIKLTDNLVHLFSNNHLIFAIGRNVGLMAMETLPLMRDILAHQAMGRSFHL